MVRDYSYDVTGTFLFLFLMSASGSQSFLVSGMMTGEHILHCLALDQVVGIETITAGLQKPWIG
jgi:hypothetical protein